MKKKRMRLFIFSFVLALFIVKCYVAIIDEGATGDLDLYRNWASNFLKYGLNIYEYQPNIDYPPLYFIILSPFVFITEHIQSINNFGLSGLLLKFPAIIADFISAYFIYRIIHRQLNKQLISLMAAFFYLIHPAILVNTSGWGQTDSILTMLLIIVLKLISERKLKYAMIISGIALLFKPTAILFIPLIGILFIMYKNIKEQLISGIIFVTVIVLMALPFKGFNIFKLYLLDMGKYPRAALHTANLHTFLKGDLVLDSQKVLYMPFTYKQMGITLTLIFILFIGYLIYKKRDVLDKWIFTLAWLYSTGVFILMSNMHERYQFFSVALGLLAIFENWEQINIMRLYLIQSIIIFLNQFMVLHFGKAEQQLLRVEWIQPFTITVEILAGLNIVCFIILLIIVIHEMKKQQKIAKLDSQIMLNSLDLNYDII